MIRRTLQFLHKSTVFTLRTCGFLLTFSLFVGTIGYVLLEDYTWVEAFYMSVITISTVGFSEIKPLSTAGRIFTSFFVITNLASTAIFVSALTQHLRGGGLFNKLRDVLMKTEISALRRHVIVCGSGRYGQQVIELLSDTEELVLVESNQECIDKIIEKHPSMLYIKGNATNDQDLIKAGILHAKTLIVTLGDDSDNAFCVLSARQLCNKQPAFSRLNIIARVYKAESRAKLLRVGTDHVVQPEQIGSFFMATLVRKPSAVEFFSSLASGESTQAGFEEIPFDKLPEEFQGKSIQQMDLRNRTGASIIAIRHKDGKYQVNPNPTTTIKNGTSLIALGDAEQIEKLNQLLSQ